MDLLRLFTSLVAPALTQARTADPFAVDTGPPGSGGPPLPVDGLQKEVAATEPKPQAQILDLLERILPSGTPQPVKGKGQGLQLLDIAINVGELKAKVESPDFGDVLVALGIPAPTGFDGTSLDAFEKAVAGAAVDAALPAPVRALFAKVVRALGDFKLEAPQLYLSSGQVPQTRVIGPPLVLTEPVGPPVFGENPGPVGPPVFIENPEPVGPPVFVERNGLVGPPVFVGGTDPVGPPVWIEGPEKDSLPEFREQPRPVGPPVLVKDGSWLPPSPVGPPVGFTRQIGPPELVNRLFRSAQDVPTDKQAGLVVSGRAVPDDGLTAKVIKQPVTARIEPTIVEALRVVGVNVSDVIPLSQATRHAQGPIPEKIAEPQTAERVVVPTTNADTEVPLDQAPVTVEPDLASKELEAIEAPTDVADPALEVAPQGTRFVETDRRPEPVTTKPQITSEQLTETRQRVIEQIEEIVATRGNGRTTIRLNPQELGTLTVTVTSLGDNVEAKVTASNEGVRHALHAHRADLVQGVESRGLTMNSFSVGHEANNDQQGHARQHQDMRQEFARSFNLRSETTTTARPQFARLAHAGVDTLA